MDNRTNSDVKSDAGGRSPVHKPGVGNDVNETTEYAEKAQKIERSEIPMKSENLTTKNTKKH